MSLGSRIIKRGKAATVASLASTPREPLLFLYPQCMKTSSLAASDRTFIRNARIPLSSRRYYTTVPIVQFNPANETPVDTPHETDPVKTESGVASIQATDSQAPGEDVTAEGAILTARTKSPVSHKSTTKVRVRKLPPHPGVAVPKHLLDKHGSNIQSDVNRALRAQQIKKRSTLRACAIRKIYHEERRVKTQSWMPDWRVILSQLRRYTPQNDEWLEKAVYITVPDSAAEEFFNGVDNNMWTIAKTYGTSVRLANRRSQTGRYNAFIIAGPAIAISRTAAEVFRIAPESVLEAGPQALIWARSGHTASSTVIDLEDGSTTGADVRLVRMTQHPVPAVRPDTHPRPSQWTTRTFVDYVTNLVSLKLPNHVHRLWYKRNEDHLETVAEALREAFSNPDCRSSLSRTAFNRAMAFYVKTARITDARSAFVLMEMVGIPMNPETFNTLLRGAATQENQHVFQFVLHLMLRRDVMPNSGTWIAFLMANRDFNIKTQIASAMKQKGLLGHLRTLQAVCEQLISQEINASLDAGQSQEDFLNHMDSRYGVRWLTVDSANRVLHVLGARYLISRCWEFILAMDARQIKPDQVSINTILNHCKQTQNVTGAIEIMNSLPSVFHFVPDEDTYHALFELAWRSRSYNLARIVWKYACLNAGTTSRMRMLVYRSLLNDDEGLTTNSSRKTIWKQQAGRVITSNNGLHPTQELLPEVLSELDLKVSKASDEKFKWRMAMKAHLERDYHIFEFFVPTRPFEQMLMEAWERDLTWRRDWLDITGRARLDWKLDNSIAVPLRSSGGGKRFTKLLWT